MAVLVIKVEDAGTLLMNEFFDYDGWCYGLTRSRMQNTEKCINLEDFYEATVRSTQLKHVPVVFVTRHTDQTESDMNDEFCLAGWYREAVIYRNIQRLSFFMEGNVKADARQVCLLPEDERQQILRCYFGNRFYEVIEEDDERYQPLMMQMQNYGGQNAFLRYALADIQLDRMARRDYDRCIEYCMELARRLMGDACRDIREIRALELYAEQACVLNGRAADGHYYLAMACHQLGQVKKGMKAIEKALKLEPEAADILAMKGNLLISMGYAEAAAGLFHKAWTSEGDEDYLILEGRAWMFRGQMDKAMACLKQVSNKQALEDAGINLKDMERRWPFINVRGFSLRHLLGKKGEGQ